MRKSTFESVTFSPSGARVTCRAMTSPAAVEFGADRGLLGAADLEVELRGEVLPVLLVELRDVDAAGRLGDGVAEVVVGRGDVGGRDRRAPWSRAGRRWRGCRAAPRRRCRRASPCVSLVTVPCGRLHAVDLQPGDAAELAEAVAERAGVLGRHLELQAGVELPERELLQFRLTHAPLRLHHRREELLVRLVHVLDLDAGLDALALGQGRGGADLLLDEGDRERAEGREVREVADLTLELLDLRSPDAQFLLRFEELT